LKLREEIEERSAAALSQQNLDVVVPPLPGLLRKPEVAAAETPVVAPPVASLPATPMPTVSAAPLFDLDSIPLRDSHEDGIEPARTSVVSVLFLAVLLAVSGGFGYWAFYAGRSLQPADVDRIVSMVRRELGESMNRWKRAAAAQKPNDLPALEPQEATTVDVDSEPGDARSEPPPPPNILIFSPRPGSITRGGPTNLCYAVSDASQVRLEPDVGDVDPTRSLSCVRVTPARTTTYELTASNRAGQLVTQQLVIIVR
jgi:hypothetical protein